MTDGAALINNSSYSRPIKLLLGEKYFDCVTGEPALPKNCYETAAFLTGLDFRNNREPGREIMVDQDKISALLASGGYRKVAEAVIFRAVRERGKTEETLVSVDLSAVPKGLKTGDLVLLGGRAVDKMGNEVDRFVHAMVYLGRERGKDFVFEKYNGDCGPRSPYQAIPLNEVLTEMLGLNARYNNIYIDRVFVQRQRVDEHRRRL